VLVGNAVETHKDLCFECSAEEQVTSTAAMQIAHASVAEDIGRSIVLVDTVLEETASAEA